jgi:hypothetical protein
MPKQTRQVQRATERQLKKDYFRGANAANVLATIANLNNAVNNLNMSFYTLFELLKEKTGLTEIDFHEKRKQLVEKGGNDAAAN